MLKVGIPKSKADIQKQIAALEYQIPLDTNEKDREIHTQALEDLRAVEKDLERRDRDMEENKKEIAPEVPVLEQSDDQKIISKKGKTHIPCTLRLKPCDEIPR